MDSAYAAETFQCFIARFVRRLKTKQFRRLEPECVLFEFHFNCVGTIVLVAQ